jgi:hypothetical protein
MVTYYTFVLIPREELTIYCLAFDPFFKPLHTLIIPLLLLFISKVYFLREISLTGDELPKAFLLFAGVPTSGASTAAMRMLIVWADSSFLLKSGLVSVLSIIEIIDERASDY